MAKDDEWGACEVCGEPAIDRCIDIVEVPLNAGGDERYKPSKNPMRRGCEKHPVQSRIVAGWRG